MLSQQTLPAGAAPPAPLTRSECRVYERHSCDLATRCQPPTVWGGRDLKWSASVRDISQTGVRLVLRRRFEPGAGLTLELPTPDAEPATVLVRVVHVRGDGDGSWSLGCSFISPLGDEELQALLGLHDGSAEPEPPTHADVLLAITGPDGPLGRLLVRRLAAPGPWPPPPGKVFLLRTGHPDAPAARLRIDACLPDGDGWALACTHLGQVPASAAGKA